MLPSDINRQIQNIVGTGKIIAIDLSVAPGLVRIEIDEGVPSDWMPYGMPFVGGTWIWCAPKIGVKGVVVSVGGEDEVCRFMPNLFDVSNYPYLSEADFKIHFNNGDEIHHNAESGALTINSSSMVTVNTQKAEVNAPEITLNGNVTITQTLTVQGFTNLNGGFAMNGGMARSGVYGTINIPVTFTAEPTIMGVTWSTHTHTGVQPGGGNTGGVG